MGAGLAASGAAPHGDRTVPGSVLGRAVAVATVARTRDRARAVHRPGACRRAADGLVPLAEPRAGAEPARSWLRHRPSSGDHAHRYALDTGSGRTRIVAGAARAHAHLAEAHSSRPAV